MIFSLLSTLIFFIIASFAFLPDEAANEVEALGVMGDVEGRTCVIIDDMVDTAGTICAAVDTLAAHGASDVLCATTHAVFSGPAVDRLKNSALRT